MTSMEPSIDVMDSFDKSLFIKPRRPPDVVQVTVFGDSTSIVYNADYLPVNAIPSFPKPPMSMNYNSEEMYEHQMMKWCRALFDFQKKVSLPVPLAFALPRPEPPLIIPKSIYEDPLELSRIRNQSPLLTPANHLHLEKIFHAEIQVTSRDIFPDTGLDKQPLKLESRINTKPYWGSDLIPIRPSPQMYSTFTEYEEAMMRWACLVADSGVEIPPSVSAVGNATGLVNQNLLSAIPPPPPAPPDEVELITWMHGLSASPKSMSAILKLQKSYTDACRLPGMGASVEVDYKAYAPTHAHTNGKKIVRHFQKFGVPYHPPTGSNVFFGEKAVSDVGLLASPEFLHCSLPLDPNDARLAHALSHNLSRIMFMDYTPYDFSILVRSTMYGSEKTIGDIIVSKLGISKILALSYCTQDLRSSVRFSILVHHILQNPKWYDQILALDMESLDRFIELAVFTGQMSYPVPVMPIEEIALAVSSDTVWSNAIGKCAGLFKQAQLLISLRYVIFATGDICYPFYRIMRYLMNDICVKIHSVIKQKGVMDRIIAGFTDASCSATQMFYFRLLRTTIMLDSRMLIRILGKHKWIDILMNGLNSNVEHIYSTTRSLCQLFRHSSAGIALREQLINMDPGKLTSMYNAASQIGKTFILDVFRSFKNTSKSFEYMPLPSTQYMAYIMAANRIPELTYRILSLCRNEDCIYAPNKADFHSQVSKFCATIAPKCIHKTDVWKVSCLKIMFKLTFIEPSVVNNVSLLSDIFGLINSDASAGVRRAAWNTIKNALLYQAGFYSFISQSKGLMDQFITSLTKSDREYSMKFVLSLARAETRLTFMDTDRSNNLSGFFLMLSDPAIPFSRLLVEIYETSSLRSHVLLFIVEVLKSSTTSPLREFMVPMHMVTPLGPIIVDIAKIHSIKIQ